jgi:hypothetical protein
MNDDELQILDSIQAVAQQGRAVVSADDSTVVAMMQEALRAGRSATFYVSPAQAQAVTRWYWTPSRVKDFELEPVSKDERARIESELGVKDMGPWYSNRIECQCGGVYGGYEFIQQGLRQHGRQWVGAVVEMKNVSVLRINPTQDAFCPQCNEYVITNHWYQMVDSRGTMIYGCCGGSI